MSESVIENFIISKAEFIFKAFDKYENTKKLPQIRYFTKNEICNVILELCIEIYPCFKKLGVGYPVIKFRRMVSQWGNCHTQKGILTFNINLMYTPLECIKYVICHEFIHILVSNHSERFYDELSKVCPNRKEYKNKIINSNKEFCDCEFHWMFTDADAYGKSVGKTLPAYPEQVKKVYAKKRFIVEMLQKFHVNRVEKLCCCV